MKTIIVYESTHHGNTKKLVDAIAAAHHVAIIDVTAAARADLSQYETIGIASGVAFGKLYAASEAFVAEGLPEGKNVFFLYTCGKDSGKYADKVSALAEQKNCRVLGVYGCLGYDTYGPFRFIGGIAKGHPNSEDVAQAVAFVGNILKNK
ncbi:flavodoxin domain-containing protein [Vagococcus acidifermentans]|uniref:Flavodoxin n=1 Tax=Vagococcus acidifermentans TaxID=564710 RepID=A0A430B0A4_9ENTE|nr:flavodoxin domain-containing protein [Vagococcus acidifermentans]RSU13777.1 flavodoxin [Vagococcus acidifermentans]